MDNYTILHTISIGGYSTVKKAKDSTGKTFAIKIISNTRDINTIRKEIQIHKYLCSSKENIINNEIHNNILILYNTFHNNLILEYAPYDLFSLIIPNLGIKDKDILHLYFIQIISAINYIHSKNICHRDIKPENILITSNGTLKLADFGQSTLFVHKNKIRMLTTVAGSLPYMAPEIVRNKRYYGDKIDIWSIGILLVVLSTGTIPWKIARKDNKEYNLFRTYKYHNYTPFSNINKNILSLIEKLLQYNPSKRISIKDIIKSEYYNTKNKFLENNKIINNNILLHNIKNNIEIEIKPFSQPIDNIKNSIEKTNINSIFYSNPVNTTRRIYINDNLSIISSTVEHLLSEMNIPSIEKYNNIINGKNITHRFNTVDRYRNIIQGTIIIQQLEERVFIQFNRIRGDGLEFKILCNTFVERLKKILY